MRNMTLSQFVFDTINMIDAAQSSGSFVHTGPKNIIKQKALKHLNNKRIKAFLLELLTGFEPVTSSLPRTCSAY